MELRLKDMFTKQLKTIYCCLKKVRHYNDIRIATINVTTLWEDMKLAMVVKAAIDLNIDILAIQEVRRISSGYSIFDDGSLKGWRWVWSGHKRKHEQYVSKI